MTQQDTEVQNFEQHDVESPNKASAKGWFVVIEWLLLGGLFLLAWPLAFIAVVFAVPGNPDAFGEVVFMLMFSYVTFYPFVYISCLVTAIVKLRGRSKFGSGRFYHQASFYARIPVYYVFLPIAILLCFVAFMTWCG